MFGIGLPELILILAVALIVVGPDKLPELAKTLAKQVIELKRAANALRDSLNDESEKPAWQQVSPERPQIAEFTPWVKPPEAINSDPDQVHEAESDLEQEPSDSDQPNGVGGHAVARHT